MQDDVVSLVKKAHNGVGVDLAFDCAGNQRTFDCAMDCTRALGTIVNVALWSNRATIDLQVRALICLLDLNKCFPNSATLME